MEKTRFPGFSCSRKSLELRPRPERLLGSEKNLETWSFPPETWAFQEKLPKPGKNKVLARFWLKKLPKPVKNTVFGKVLLEKATNTLGKPGFGKVQVEKSYKNRVFPRCWLLFLKSLGFRWTRPGFQVFLASKRCPNTNRVQLNQLNVTPK